MIHKFIIPIFCFFLGSLVNYTCPAGKSFNGSFYNVLESYCAESDKRDQFEWTYNSDNVVPECLGKMIIEWEKLIKRYEESKKKYLLKLQVL